MSGKAALGAPGVLNEPGVGYRGLKELLEGDVNLGV